GPGAAISAVVPYELSWWGRHINTLHFALGTAAVFAAWMVFGAYRLMCQELQVRTTPWAWAVFVLFLPWYLAGFVPQRSVAVLPAVFLIAGLLVSTALTYLMLFTEQTGALVMRRAWVRVQRREWRRALEEIPCWPVSLVIAAVFGLLLMLTISQRPVVLEGA